MPVMLLTKNTDGQYTSLHDLLVKIILKNTTPL